LKSKLIIGGAQFGSNYGVSNNLGQVSKQNIISILDYAYSEGIDIIDTAKSYGNSESVIGDYIGSKEKPTFKVITKIGQVNNDLFKQVRDSIEKLSVDSVSLLTHSTKLYLDYYYQDEIQELKNKKYISKVGVSVYTQKEIEKILSSDLTPDIIQLPINILDTRLYHSGIISELSRIGIDIHARSIFLQGLFFLPNELLIKRFPDVVPSINKLQKISNDIGCTIGEISLLWVNSMNEISKIIIGIDKVSQLKENLNTLSKNLQYSSYERALEIKYENNNILNPSLWV
tara:strand:+ start:2123 stop:2983 length:861 start_codon:yes stop_codon:yes gene_type:complete